MNSGIDWKKIGTGAAISVGGALVGYVSETMVPYLNGVGTPIALTIASLSSVGINVVRKWYQSRFGKPNA